jgi:hypothetical protein
MSAEQIGRCGTNLTHSSSDRKLGEMHPQSDQRNDLCSLGNKVHFFCSVSNIIACIYCIKLYLPHI